MISRVVAVFSMAVFCVWLTPAVSVAAGASSSNGKVDPLDACRQAVVATAIADAQKKKPASDASAPANDDAVRAAALKEMVQPIGEYAVSFCLVKGHHYAEATPILTSLAHTLGAEPALDESAALTHLRILVYYVLAVADDGMKKHADAANAMKIAHDRAVENSEDTSDFEDEYERLAPQQFKAEWALRDKIAQQLEQQRLAPIVAYWDKASADERRILALHGGTRRDNLKARPCHVETFTARGGYDEVTWWYCNAAGSYVRAYTFLNGALHSQYDP